MARRRPPADVHPVRLDGVPPELAAGPCIELWADADEEPPDYWGSDRRPSWHAFAAWRRYSTARHAWALDHDPPLPPAEMFRLMPSRAPYSARYLAATGREERARELLGALADAVLGVPARRPVVRQKRDTV